MPDSVNPSDWYAKAYQQFLAAKLLRVDVPTLCVVHLQQSAEMLLKGRMLEAGMNPARIHSTEALQKELLNAGISFPPLADPALLDASYFEARYPVSGYFVPTEAEIDGAVEDISRLGEIFAPTMFKIP